MVPFRLAFQPGISLCEQLVYAAKRAIISGHLLAGDQFPSVRALSKDFKINPNTAHKVISQLTAEGLLEVRVGIGTVVAERNISTHLERSRLLKGELEKLVVEAKKLNMNLEDVLNAVSQHWARLSEKGTGSSSRKGTE